MKRDYTPIINVLEKMILSTYGKRASPSSVWSPSVYIGFNSGFIHRDLAKPAEPYFELINGFVLLYDSAGRFYGISSQNMLRLGLVVKKDSTETFKLGDIVNEKTITNLEIVEGCLLINGVPVKTFLKKKRFISKFFFWKKS